MRVINSSVELLIVVNRVTNRLGFCQFLLDQLTCLDVIVNTWMVDLLIVLDDHGQCKENSSDIMICYFFLVCLLNAFVTTK